MPENPLQLMRSRYVAYVLQKAAYIIATTHPLNPQYKKNIEEWTKEILQFCKSARFKKLEIINFIDGEKEGYVTFTAHLEIDGQDATFTEKSRFEKVDGRWLYLSGDISGST